MFHFFFFQFAHLHEAKIPDPNLKRLLPLNKVSSFAISHKLYTRRKL